MSINKVILIGRCTEPETKHLEKSQVSNFSLATTEKYTNRNGEKVEDVEWHSIVIWGKLSEIVEKYVKKGTQLYIEGKLKTRIWEDKEGNKRYTTEVVLNGFECKLQMIGGKKDESNLGAQNESRHNEEDDIPF